jgi:hypothetical protein
VVAASGGSGAVGGGDGRKGEQRRAAHQHERGNRLRRRGESSGLGSIRDDPVLWLNG